MIRSRVTLATIDAAATLAQRRSPATRFFCGQGRAGRLTKSVMISSGMTASCASARAIDRKSTRLNSSHVRISYAVFCLKTKNSRDNREDHVNPFHRAHLRPNTRIQGQPSFMHQNLLAEHPEAVPPSRRESLAVHSRYIL